MFPNPQDALPLTPRPNLEQYKKLAKDLVKACHSEDGKDVHAWAARWISNLVAHAGTNSTALADRWTLDVEVFARKKLLGTSSDKPRLADTQFVIARAHGFESWPRFTRHIKALEQSGQASDFEAAADAIVRGDLAELNRLLHQNPNLVKTRSDREHRATLLHYVSANGIESYRQKTPQNIVEITDLLLRSGAEVDAPAEVYGGQNTTLELTATSVHPERAGVQVELLDTLLRAGADINHASRAGQSIVDASLANGRYRAAQFLAERGATLSIEAAAGLGRLDDLEDFFGEDGSLNRPTTQVQLQHAFHWACEYGHNGAIAFLLDRGVDIHTQADTGQTGLHWAVIGGQLHTVKLLLSRGASVTNRNNYKATPLGQALWSAIFGDSGTDYVPIVETLLESGSRIDEGTLAWLSEQKARPQLCEHLIALLRRHGSKS